MSTSPVKRAQKNPAIGRLRRDELAVRNAAGISLAPPRASRIHRGSSPGINTNVRPPYVVRIPRGPRTTKRECRKVDEVVSPFGWFSAHRSATPIQSPLTRGQAIKRLVHPLGLNRAERSITAAIAGNPSSRSSASEGVLLQGFTALIAQLCGFHRFRQRVLQGVKFHLHTKRECAESVEAAVEEDRLASPGGAGDGAAQTTPLKSRGYAGSTQDLTSCSS